jgi:hypothetical protein
MPDGLPRSGIREFLSRAVAPAVYAGLQGLTITTEVAAEPSKDPWLDLPRVLNARETDGKSYMWVTCEAIPNARPRQARCTFSQFIITKPRASLPPADREILERMAKTGQWTAEATKACGSDAMSGKSPDPANLPKTPELRQVFIAIREACHKKDAEGLARLLFAQAEKEAKTCSVTFSSDVEVFVQRNSDTWSTTQTGPCGTTVMTLWRMSSAMSLWSYSQARSISPNAPTDNLLGCDKLSTRTDWQWWDRPTLPIGCEFID